jgi:hypothetical protein
MKAKCQLTHFNSFEVDTLLTLNGAELTLYSLKCESGLFRTWRSSRTYVKPVPLRSVIHVVAHLCQRHRAKRGACRWPRKKTKNQKAERHSDIRLNDKQLIVDQSRALVRETGKHQPTRQEEINH